MESVDVADVIGAGDSVVINEVVPSGYDGVLIRTINFFTGTGFLEGSGSIAWRSRLGTDTRATLEIYGSPMDLCNSPTSFWKWDQAS